MKFGMVNKSTTVNRIVLPILQRNITRLAVITRKTNIGSFPVPPFQNTEFYV